ncbi:hypothetical protein HZA43_03610 [Candidatus Peregrinibacteria bacterium]|nr:hypothetical protein [Candidatus Peregrinibacteria bacterium]
MSIEQTDIIDRQANQAQINRHREEEETDSQQSASGGRQRKQRQSDPSPASGMAKAAIGGMKKKLLIAVGATGGVAGIGSLINYLIG